MAPIPAPLANAMFPGVIIVPVFSLIKAIGFNPALGLPIHYRLDRGRAFRWLFAVPVALVAFVLMMTFLVEIPAGALDSVGNR